MADSALYSRSINFETSITRLIFENRRDAALADISSNSLRPHCQIFGCQVEVNISWSSSSFYGVFWNYFYLFCIC